ncbi:MAG: methylmalonyl Co-A mutase-associated GTPase MeaB [Bacteroidota bacterium]
MQEPSNSRKEAIQRIRDEKVRRHDVDRIFSELKSGRRDALGMAITWVESNHPAHVEQANALLAKCLVDSGKSRRIGITGVPGVGKSTFIERFGLELIGQGHKVAVLAIDPSSQRTGGSILGDKTRMELLSRHNQAFVRPSPAADTLGGVARATRETIVLCEAAGFDTILVETVGVGQSEIAVNGMVDFFLLLLLAGAGDELQGIKRGIMEMADAVLITKADGDNMRAADKAKSQVKSALHLFPQTPSGWIPAVSTCSALENTGIAESVDMISSFFDQITRTGWMEKHREQQELAWFHEAVKNEVLRNFQAREGVLEKMRQLEGDVRAKKITPFAAARMLLG